MGIPININDILYARRVESTRIEYKASFNPDAIIRTICAFANDIDNTGGGYIVIGVEEENGIPKLPIKGIEKESIDGILKKMLEYWALRVHLWVKQQISCRLLAGIKPSGKRYYKARTA